MREAKTEAVATLERFCDWMENPPPDGGPRSVYGMTALHGRQLLSKLHAAEAEVERLREGIRKVSERLRTGTHCRTCEHMLDMCDCKEITAEYDALLTPPQQEAGNEP